MRSSSESPVRVMKDPQRLSPVIVGSALAATVAIGYTLCAATWAIWNEAHFV